MKDFTFEAENWLDRLHDLKDPCERDAMSNINEVIGTLGIRKTGQNSKSIPTLTAADIKNLFEFFYKIAYDFDKKKEPVNIFTMITNHCVKNFAEKKINSQQKSKEMRETILRIHHALNFLLDTQLLEWCYHFDKFFPDIIVPDVLKILRTCNF